MDVMIEVVLIYCWQHTAFLNDVALFVKMPVNIIMLHNHAFEIKNNVHTNILVNFFLLNSYQKTSWIDNSRMSW